MESTRYSLLDQEKKQELLGIWSRDKGLTGANLKLLACLFMLIDHISQSNLLLQTSGIGVGGVLNFWSEPKGLMIGSVMVLIGRMAFPIYCFFLVQGIFLTKDYKKYISRLFLFGFISEIPFDLALFGQISLSHQNVFFTLGLGATMILALEKWPQYVENKNGLMLGKVGIFIIAMILAELANTDYGLNGIYAIFAFYMGVYDRLKSILWGFLGFFFEAPLYGMVYLSLPLIYFYNGKRGRMNKYFYYLFYPVHLGLIYILRDYLLPLF